MAIPYFYSAKASAMCYILIKINENAYKKLITVKKRGQGGGGT